MNLQAIQSKIFQIRNQSVMFDNDLGDLYQVPTKRINEAVKRNQNRFPPDFIFQLSHEEWQILKSQNAAASWGGLKKKESLYLCKHIVPRVSFGHTCIATVPFPEVYFFYEC